MPEEAPSTRVEVRHDPPTARELAAIRQRLRATTSVAVRMAIAELARSLGISEDADTTASSAREQGKAAA